MGWIHCQEDSLAHDETLGADGSGSRSCRSIGLPGQCRPDDGDTGGGCFSPVDPDADAGSDDRQPANSISNLHVSDGRGTYWCTSCYLNARASTNCGSGSSWGTRADTSINGDPGCRFSGEARADGHSVFCSSWRAGANGSTGRASCQHDGPRRVGRLSQRRAL